MPCCYPSNYALGIIDVTSGTSVELKLVKDSLNKVRYQYPRLKRDRSRIYFSSNLHDVRSKFDIYSVAPDGSDLKRITNTPDVSETYAVLSPDESKYAYVAEDTKGQEQIFVMNIDGTGSRPVTNTTFQGYEDLLWSNDGTRIIYTIPLGHGIYSHNLVDNTTDKLVNNQADATSVFPLGDRIMYYMKPSYNILELYSVNFDGSNGMQLTSFGAVTAEGTWSPDGKFIAFASNMESNNSRFIEVFIALARNPNTLIKINTPLTDKYHLEWR